MQFTTAFLSLLSLASASPLLSRQAENGTVVTPVGPVNLTNIYTCGGRPFRPREYTCYDDTQLCPVLDGLRTRACGVACYNPTIYGCTDGVLVQVAGGRFVMNGTIADTTAESESSYTGDYDGDNNVSD
ncbi:hypothetical protein LTS18_006355 [Coniosporium uncinatum]|uniref:Uncharacterized protein n=1 Tax=Coniosporium uncinatum TaxID=93489 RepID=A0ACC3DQ84_9PEZI|nr:hypothetical protein LTS18_006355 [Coniosporium uncinatum]